MKVWSIGKLLFISLAINLVSIPPILASDKSHSTHNTTNANLLLRVPQTKAKIGVIPYYIHNDEIYILLGRERIDGPKPTAAGRFSDLGGNVIFDGSTFAQNAARELKEESMGEIDIDANELLSKSLVLHIPDVSGRELIYLLFPFTQQQYLNTKNFNSLRSELNAQGIAAQYLEKDQYYWFNFKDIMRKTSELHDIDGNIHEIKLREVFVQDFINNPELADLVTNLRK